MQHIPFPAFNVLQAWKPIKMHSRESEKWCKWEEAAQRIITIPSLWLLISLIFIKSQLCQALIHFLFIFERLQLITFKDTFLKWLMTSSNSWKGDNKSEKTGSKLENYGDSVWKNSWSALSVALVRTQWEISAWTNSLSLFKQHTHFAVRYLGTRFLRWRLAQVYVAATDQKEI